MKDWSLVQGHTEGEQEQKLRSSPQNFWCEIKAALAPHNWFPSELWFGRVIEASFEIISQGWIFV